MCNKSCKCNNCEMLQRNHFITFINDLEPFNEQRVTVNGFKCGYTGKCDVDTNALKRAGFIDDLIFASQNRIAIDYIKLYTGF